MVDPKMTVGAATDGTAIMRKGVSEEAPDDAALVRRTRRLRQTLTASPTGRPRRFTGRVLGTGGGPRGRQVKPSSVDDCCLT